MEGPTVQPANLHTDTPHAHTYKYKEGSGPMARRYPIPIPIRSLNVYTLSKFGYLGEPARERLCACGCGGWRQQPGSATEDYC